MSRAKLSSFDTAASLTTFDYFVGVRYNDSTGEFENIKFTYAQIAALAGGASKVITCSSDGNTITDVFFDTYTIKMIVASNQSYVAGQDFTQSGDTITAISFGVYTGLIIYVTA